MQFEAMKNAAIMSQPPPINGIPLNCLPNHNSVGRTQSLNAQLESHLVQQTNQENHLPHPMAPVRYYFVVQKASNYNFSHTIFNSSTALHRFLHHPGPTQLSNRCTTVSTLAAINRFLYHPIRVLETPCLAQHFPSLPSLHRLRRRHLERRPEKDKCILHQRPSGGRVS